MKHPETAALAKSARARLELSQAQFGKLFQQGTRTIAEWDAGEKKPNGAARVLLSLINVGYVDTRMIMVATGRAR